MYQCYDGILYELVYGGYLVSVNRRYPVSDSV